MIARCIDFLKVSDKYNLGPIGAEIVYEPLHRSWGWTSAQDDICEIMGVDIETVFAIAPIGHRLRNLVLRTALFDQMDDVGAGDVVGNLLPQNHRFLEQEVNTEGYAMSLLELIFNHSEARLNTEALRKLGD